MTSFIFPYDPGPRSAGAVFGILSALILLAGLVEAASAWGDLPGGPTSGLLSKVTRGLSTALGVGFAGMASFAVATFCCAFGRCTFCLAR
eukprot:5234806-Amphidinium_carterae.1